MGSYYILEIGVAWDFEPIEITGDSPLKAMRTKFPDYNITRVNKMNWSKGDVTLSTNAGIFRYRVRNDKGDMPKYKEVFP